MKKISDLRKFHEELNTVFYDLEKDHEFPNHFYQALLSGENSVYQKSISEIKTFHEEWIGTIESYFNSLDKITKDPKSGLKYLQEVEAIEKAKKVNSDSIRHLASHTHLIKEVKHGDVIPKKILTTQAEINYAIYENRFVMTLINRLFDFVNQRYELVKSNVDSYNNKYFNFKSEFDMRESHIDFEINMKIKEDLENESINRQSHELLRRIEFLLKKVNGLKTSVFMETLKNAKPVIAPIMKTQIITKNVDYKNCYNLWLFLDKYNTLNFDLNILEQNLTFDRYYMRNIYQTVLTAFTTVYGNQKALEDHYQYVDVQEYKKKSPKVIKKTLDELMSSADPFVLENTQINQYFLDQNKQVFKERLNKALEESSSYDIALRKAMRETIQITNALFQDFFELGEDDESEESFFQRMVKSDLEDELTKAKDKARIARVIRETKEVDYNSAIRLEKRMLREIERIDKEIIKQTKRKNMELAKKMAIEERIRLERESLDSNQQALSDYLEFVSNTKQLLADEHRDVQDKIKEKAKLIKIEEKRIIELEKKKARDQYVASMKKLKDKQKRDKLKAQALLKKQLDAEKKRLLSETKKLEQQSKERIKTEKQKITTDIKNNQPAED
jgi:DNA repair protein SbcC/Rad50